MSALTLNQADLQFVLFQIQVAEAHSAGIPLTSILLDAAGRVIADPAAVNIGTGQTYYVLDSQNKLVPRDPSQPLAIPDPHVPVGLRTVDGSNNNIVPGRELWGASGQPMPRLFEPNYINDGDGDQMPLGPGAVVTNNDYGVTNGTANGTNGGNTGNVADADPRTISNLIVDMSMNNPAAILAALTFAGSEDPMADLNEILALRISATEAADALAAAAEALDVANDALDAAVEAYVPGNADAIDDIQEAAEAVTTAEANLAQAQAVAANPHAAMVALAEAKGLTFNNGSLDIPNIAPDEGLSAPFNAWMTFFGQFFDHGLDLISKGGNGTIYVPLAADDPLVLGNDGVAGTSDDLAPHLRFMTLTRSTTVPGEGGEPTQRNVTTPFVDQNQTYTSHASHQVFLREYAMVNDRPVATGKLLGGEDGGLATWADVKAQARESLGIELTDMDVFAVPLLRTDAYGEFIRDPGTGFPQVIIGLGLDGIPNTADDVVVSGTPDAPVDLFAVGAIRTNNAFLDDIAHDAVPGTVFDHDGNPATAPIVVEADANDIVNAGPIETDGRGRKTSYDNELLDRHFITGDGRGNENIGLTAVHHVFHSEHNRQVDQQKLTILTTGNLDFVNQWLSVDTDATTLANFNAGYSAAENKAEFLETSSLFNGTSWDGERLFQAARFATEMQYQHLVFEEFGRKIQPNIDVFVFNSITDVDPRIFSEFANVVYRFGHSMLTENMPRIDASGNVMDGGDLTLIESFLNPVLFDNDGGISHDEGAAAIIRGMTIERGNEIDEFVTGALRNNLLGLPLDLAAINIARGRDTGMPTLNQAREQLFDASGSSFLTPYNSWVDFAANLKNPLSVVNFIAAYGEHSSIMSATTLEAKRDAAWLLVFGGEGAPTDRLDFLNSTGTWNADNSGLNDIDLWIGGLAERKMPFGGFLGSTFNAVFELQMENLQDGDRFYYLTRTQGQNLLNSLEQNSFAKMLMANTSLAQPGPDGIRGTADDIVERHIGVDSFATYDYVLEVNPNNQADYDPDNESASGVDPVGNDPVLEALGLGKVIRNDPATVGPDANYIRVFGGEHVVVGGTNGNDTIITDFGDDGIWGDAGDDRIESGAGVDLVNGGAGNDIITDSGDSGDFLKGDEGDDVIANSNGLDILMGGSGKDVFFVGVDATEVFAGQGDDFILGGDDMDFLLGNEGDDWMEAGGGFDTTAGDNSELFFNSAIKGHDVMFAGADEHDFDAESGDDIMVQGESVMRNEGMFGFDWAIFKGMSLDGYADMNIPIFTTEQADILRNRFDSTEALSGWKNNDTLIGDSRVQGTEGTTIGTAEGVFFNDGLDQAGIDRIAGLDQIVQVGPTGFFEAGNILLGGAGSDIIEGNGGDDILDGDRWLNVRIRITGAGDANAPDNQIATVDSLKHVFTEDDAGDPSWIGKSLFELMIARTIVPNQLHIVREIIEDDGAGDTDIAVFNDIRANYAISGNADGSIRVEHVTVSNVIDPANGRNLVSDGIDTLRNFEVLRFADGDFALTPPELRLNGFDTGVFADNFDTAAFTNSTGSTPWTTAWVETNDSGGVTTGQIRIDAGNSNTLQFIGNLPANGSDGAQITRGINLAGATQATLAYSANPDNLDAGESVTVQFSADGVTFVNLNTITGNGGNQGFNHTLTGPFTANAAVRFVATAITGNANEVVTINDLAINFTKPADPVTTDVEATFTEDGAAVPIASLPSIVDDSATMASARIVLTNASAGDQLVIGGLPAGIAGAIDTTVEGRITVTLTGTAPRSTYQDAIQAVTFRNTSQAPNVDDRIIHVTVNDGLADSNIATSTIHVVSVNDAPNAVNDRIVTSNVNGVAFQLPDWALMANDTDGDGPFVITGVGGANNLTATRPAGGPVTITDTGATNGGSFTYTVSDGVATDTATVQVIRDTTNPIGGGGLLGGNGGNDIMVGDGAANVLEGAGGNDLIFAGGGDDTINWTATSLGTVDLFNDGRDFADGGAGTLDRFVVNGSGSAETFVVYAAADAIAAGFTGLKPGTEIVIARNGAVIAELDNIEEITINTGAGNDTVTAVGNFNPTSLNFNTITINGDGGNDTVDVSTLQSAHRILFRSNGGNDTIVGNLRPQDVVELAPGQDISTYTLVNNGNGTQTFTNGSHSITFTGAVPPQFGGDSSPDDDAIDGVFEYSPSDIAGLKALVNGQVPANAGDDGDVPVGVRNLNGVGNNEANPQWGSADEPFIRITTARYGELDANGNRAINPVFDGLDPRNLSNILGTQEAGLPAANNEANIFFMAMGQYIDHGLDFLGKGGYGTIQIGAPGGGAPGSGNPADLTRGTVAGYDQDGVPQHINRTSPYVDQNQAYGSNSLVGQFLREGDGSGGLTAHLFAGAPDPSNPDFRLLPTLRELIEEHWDNNTVFHSASLSGGQVAFRDYFPGLVNGGVINETMLPGMISNFMGTEHALLLDTNPFINVLDHYVAGDGRANENFALTAIHTIWARNHNHHVEGLEAAGFDGTAEELFQAAKMINEAEYQRVVFDEYLDTLLGGLRSVGTHGFEQYDPNANAGISHEFAGAVFRFGHSLIGQTMTVLDANGNPTQVQLFDAFLNPSNDPSVFPADPSAYYTPQPGYAQHGVNAIIGGTISQNAEAVDFNIVDAVRNDLVRINADLFAFNVARGWDLGLGTLNQVRRDLAASTDPYVSQAVGFVGGDLSAYTSWEDFQARNGLSNTVIAQLRQAYPDLVLAADDIEAFSNVNPDINITMQLDGTGVVQGIDRLDLWVGGLAEQHVNDGMVGETFWVILSEQFERLQDGDRFYYISRFDNFDFYENFIDGQEFADIIARNTGMTDLPEHAFRTEEIDDEDTDNDDDQDDDEDNDDDDTDDDDTVGENDDDDDEDDQEEEDEDDDETDGGNEDDDDDETAGGDDDDDETTAPPPGAIRTGTPQPDVLVGTAGDDSIMGFADDDVIHAEDGADAISAGEGADLVRGGSGRDVIFAGGGNDQVFGGDHADMIYGDAGDDRLFGDQGNDMINAGAGNDTVFGGAGNDLFIAEIGDGNDVYFGDDSDGGSGIDTLDMTGITANVTATLGAGPLMNGTVSSSQTGNDTIWGIENINTGSGNDTITASNAVNIINGGAGNDTFRFLTASAADGDTIHGFEPGDRLDLSGIDANLGAAGNQSFVLVSGQEFTAAGQLVVTFETRADGDYTVVSGNIDGNLDADFKIDIAGHQTLTNTNVGL
jgi:Ca2+-binding RTX toxin-like protein